jgi:GNAT superfamily N-acetyltransferase
MDEHDLGRAPIRAATPGDAPQLALLRYRFRAELGQPVEDELAFVARAAPWIADALASPAWRAWVALDGAAIVGHIFLQLIAKVPNPIVEAETIGYITNLYVRPAQRNAGLGARLLHVALAACPAEAVDTVVLWPSQQSVALYRRAGFRPPAALLELSLGDHGA